MTKLKTLINGWRDRIRLLLPIIGGRWAICWQAVLLNCSVAFIAVYGNLAKKATSTGETFTAFIVALMTALTLASFLILLDRSIYRHRASKPVSAITLIVCGTIGGTIFSVGTAFGRTLLGGQFFAGLAEQIAANSILVIWWGASVTLILDAREKFVSQREAVIDEAIALELVKARGSDTEERLRKALNKKITSEISAARSTLNAALSNRATVTEANPNREINNSEWKPIALQLRLIANDVMRPLSRKLWTSAERVFPRPKFLKVLRSTIDSQPLRPLSMSIIVVVLSAETLVKSWGQSIAPIVLASTVLFVCLVFVGANSLMKKYSNLHSVFFMLSILLFQVFDTWIWIYASAIAGVPVTLGTLALNCIAILILVLITSGITTYSVVSGDELEKYRRDVSAKQLTVFVRNKINSTLAREAARNLHGQVQTRLLSCASAIERASKSQDLQLLDHALIEINEIFDMAAMAQNQGAPEPLINQLTEVASRWKGICEVKLRIPKQFHVSSSKAVQDLVDVVEEAVTNAVRHGSASKIDVQIARNSEGLTLTVSDNGTGMNSGKPSLGTELIHLVSAGNYSYVVNKRGGVELNLVIREK